MRRDRTRRDVRKAANVSSALSFESAGHRKASPAAWKWYVALCLLLAALNLGLIALGMWAMQNDAYLARETQNAPGTFRMYGTTYVAFGIVFAIGNLALPLLPKRPWSYVLHMTNILAAGLTCILLPIAIPVFIGWLKPETRDFFDFR
jgi:hypothetical protein